MTRRETLGEAHYCLLCHEREKDSCSKGFVDAEDRDLAEEPPRHRALGLPARREDLRDARSCGASGDSVGALALVCIDNPMCPGTGHRICNDCMKGCIFQKQDPVNIPQAETGVLTDVLSCPAGVEIYCLLTRWNPLNLRRPYRAPVQRHRRCSSSGSGPAGYTLAHYLLNEGFGVAGIDGLKIEPCRRWTGADGGGIRPIRDYSEIARDRSTSDRSPVSAASPSTASRCAGTRTS